MHTKLCIHHKDFHLFCNMLQHYLVKSENPKMLLIFKGSSTSCWHVPEDTLTNWSVVRQIVSRLLTLTDWLTFWSLSDDISNQQLNVVQLNIVASWRFFQHLHSFKAILGMLYTYLSKIISAIFLQQVTWDFSNIFGFSNFTRQSSSILQARWKFLRSQDTVYSVDKH